MKTSSSPSRWCIPLPGTATSIALAGLMLGIGCGDDSVPSNDGSTGTGGATGATDDGPPPVTDGPADTTDGTGPGSATDGSATDSATTASTGSNDTTGSEDHGELLFIEVVPTNAVLEVDLDTPAVQTYEIRGHYEDGALVDLTAQTTFSHSNPMIGMMNGENLEIPAFSDTFIGTTQITAMVDGQEGEAQLTLAAYAQTGAETDFFFVLPYEDPAGSENKPLTFSTDIKELDVFINMDTTGSMGGPITNLQTSLNTTVIPDIQASIDNTWFGVGAYMDYPVAGFGTPGCFGGNGTPYNTDQPFILLQEMTSSAVDAQAAVSALTNGGGSPIGCGADGAESHIEALYQIATGAGLPGPAPTLVPPNMNGIGGAAFREGALPVIVSVTDNSTHDPGLPLCTGATDYESNAGVFAVAATRADTHTALNDICARVVTVAVSNFNPACGPLADGVDFAEATGSLIPPEAWDLAPGGRPAGCAVGQCCTGTNGMGVAPNMDGLCPLVYQVDFGGNGVGVSTTNGVIMLANYAPFSVTTAVSGVVTDIDGVPLPPGFTTADFIKSVVPAWHGPVPLPGVANPILTPDAFENVIPNTPVTFDIEAYNDFIPATDTARLFTATISVLADSCGDLDEREIFILVPPEGLPPPG